MEQTQQPQACFPFSAPSLHRVSSESQEKDLVRTIAVRNMTFPGIAAPTLPSCLHRRSAPAP